MYIHSFKKIGGHRPIFHLPMSKDRPTDRISILGWKEYSAKRAFLYAFG